jgi:putative hemolysin
MELVIITVLILINGLLAMSEMAIVTSRKSRLKQLAANGSKRAKEASNIAENPNNFLSTIQVGITLVSIFSGAFAGENLTRPLSDVLSKIAVLDKYSEIISLGIVVSAITFLSLIFGELVPKRIALKYPETIATFAAIPMRVLSIITMPLVFLLTFSTDIVLKILRLDTKNNDSGVSREEISNMLSEGEYEGTLEKQDVKMVKRVFNLSDITVEKVMLPKSKIIAFDINEPIKEVLKKTREFSHSRYPVYKKSKGNIIGFIHIKDIYMKMVSGEKKYMFRDIFRVFNKTKNEQKLKDLKIVRPIHSINKDTKIDDAMFIIKDKGTHIAMVTDKKGKNLGMIALEDIFKKVFGEIKDEFDDTDNKKK